jgi:hypothetical protein
MTRFEYRVLPAPQRGLKARGAKTTEARFAHALMEVMNELGAEGWEYVRADTLPCEERVGLTGRTTRFQNMLVFRRVIAAEVQPAPEPPVRPAMTEAEEFRSAAARRLAAALTARPHEGMAPVVRTGAEPGPTPKLGGAIRDGESGVAAE